MLCFHAVCALCGMTCLGEALMICLVLSPEEKAPVEQARRTRPQIAARCHYVILNAEGWTVALIRHYLVQHMGDVSDATVRRQLQAGGWVYKRCATTVPRNAPSPEKKSPGSRHCRRH